MFPQYVGIEDAFAAIAFNLLLFESFKPYIRTPNLQRYFRRGRFMFTEVRRRGEKAKACLHYTVGGDM